MGLIFGKSLSKILIGHRPFISLMVGLDASGKTTILYKLKLGEIVTTIPTISFNAENVNYKKFETTVWDLSGQKMNRPLWRHYYQGASCIIFVVDSNDRERIDDLSGLDNSAKEMLHRLLAENELQNVPLLVYANKQDLPNAMSVSEMAEKLGLYQVTDKKGFIYDNTYTQVK